MSEIRLLAGLDIGNGYVKGMIRDIDFDSEPSRIDIPSCAAGVTAPGNEKWTEENIDRNMNDIYNSVDVSFSTSIIRESRHYLLGSRALASGCFVDEFGVDSPYSKAERDLSAILVLGCIACKAVQSYWNQHRDIPNETLKVKVEEVSLALPINEFREHRQEYRHRYFDTTHMVTFHDFHRLVRVEIEFSDVQVHPEGVCAQYAIADMIRTEGSSAVESMLRDIRSRGMKLPDITPDVICGAKHIVGIDIGEGTVNFPVHIDGMYNKDISRTLSQGYGTVLDRALARLKSDRRTSFPNRKALTEFIQDCPAGKKKMYDMVQDKIGEEAYLLTSSIERELDNIMYHVGSKIEVIYVYGGGATAMREHLLDTLMATIKHVTMDELGIPIMYLDSSYSRNMNRRGLYITAEAAYNARVERGLAEPSGADA